MILWPFLTSLTVDFVAVGDVMLARNVARRISQNGLDSLFSGCRSEIQKADFALGNLECVLSNAPFDTQNAIRLRAHPEFAKGLKAAGFSALAVANNHAADCGATGLKDTITSLNENGISPVGHFRKPKVLVIKGLRVALLAYCDFPETTRGIVCATDETTLREEIAAAKKVADVTIISWHWGTEGNSVANNRQKHLARLAAKYGASAVIGHHPHVLQPIEWLPSEGGGRCLVAYSLGNFVFDARPGAECQTEILHLRLDATGVVNYTVSPYRISHAAPFRVNTGDSRKG